MRRRVVPVGAIVAIVVAATVATRNPARVHDGGAPPDTLLAGAYASPPREDGGGTAYMLRLRGTMTARWATVESGDTTLVDTGAWTKDDAGAVVVTLAPRDDSDDSGDTLRFAVRGDTLVEHGTGSGSAGLTLIRSR